ncbi:DUF11 domain-containing protein [candidate division KSB1 bacterium]|nr:DUF11 domain-containing protein [candidate division KSB1 bacterium]
MNMRRLVKTLLLTLLLLPSLVFAQITTQTFVDSTGWQITNWEETAPLPKFDPSLGTLLQAKLTLQVGSIQDIYVENTSDADGTIQVTGKINIAATLPEGTEVPLQSLATVGEVYYTVYDGQLDYAGSSGRTDMDLVGGHELNRDEYSKTYTDTDLAMFIGPGTINIPGSTEALYNVRGASGTVNIVLEAEANLRAIIEYTYMREADLELEKSVDDPTPVIGQEITYTLTITNNGGPLAVDNVVVTDQLPAGLQYVSYSGDGTYDASSNEWTVGTLDVDEVKTLQIVAEVLQSGEIENSAEITAASLPDPDSTPANDIPDEDDQDSVVIAVPPQADLSLEKSVDNPTPNYRDVINYTLTVTNHGPDNATGIVVTDQLPAGLEYISYSGDGSYQSGSGEWNVGYLAANNSKSVTLQVRVVATGDINNSAEITAADADDPDSTPDNDNPAEDDQDDEPISVPEAADLSVTKTASVDQIRVGEPFTFTITVQNDGPDDATNVEVTDVLDTHFSLQSSNASQGNYSGDVWDVGTLAANSSATLTLTVVLNSEYEGVLNNVAEVTASDPYDPDSTPGNGNGGEDDQDDDDVYAVEIADLSLTKSVDNNNPQWGDQVTFTLTIENSGPDAAENVEVTDQLPSGLEFVSSNASQGSYSTQTGIWIVGNLAVNGSATLTITANVTSVDEITNIAQVTASDQRDPDSAPGNDDDTEDDQDDETLDPISIDLELTKIADKSSYYSNEEITFTLTLENTGRKTANTILVRDAIPADLSVSDVTPSMGSWSFPDSEWSLPSLASGASATLTIKATASSLGEITNSAQVIAADEPDVDSTPDNDDPDEDDQDDVTITITELIDLSLSKSVDNSSPAVRSQVVFTLTLTNDGPDVATGIEVTDVLPDGLSFASANSSDYDDATGIWSVASLNAGASVSLDITATVDRAGIYENVAEVTLATQEDSDSTPDNDNPAEDDQDSASLEAGVADLELEKSSSVSSVMQGVEFDFLITLINTGPDAVTEARVRDVLPADLTLVDSPADYNANTGVWSVGSLTVDESKTLTLTVTANTTGDIINSAQVSHSNVRDTDSTSDNNDPTEDDQDDATVTVYAPGSIGDLVWQDNNGDGVFDALEPGLENVRVTLLDGNGQTLATTLTDENGEYLFENLDQGNYTVDIDETTVPDNYDLTTSNDPMQISLGQTEHYRDADFGYQPLPSSIGDLVWQDHNANKMQDAEDGLQGIRVLLRQNGTILEFTETDANGGYLFADLLPGTYIVDIVEATLPENWELTTDNEPMTVTIGAGEDYLQADFGYRPQRAQVGDYVWQDIDGDGEQDTNEPPVADVKLVLFDSEGNEIASVLTDENGLYLFDDLAPDEYIIEIDETTIPDHHSPSTPTRITTELDPGEEELDADFGLYPEPVSIGDFVFFDLNEDGLESKSESGIANAKVILLDNQGNRLDSMFVDNEGRYMFADLVYGTYTVWVDTNSIPQYHWPTSPLKVSAELQPGDVYQEADFGFFHYRSAICNTVFHDVNANGELDQDENGIQDVTLVLMDSHKTFMLKQGTNEIGKTLFARLSEGIYYITLERETLPEKFRQTTPEDTFEVYLDGREMTCPVIFGFTYDMRSEYPQTKGKREVFAWYEPWFGNTDNDSTLRHWEPSYRGGIADTSYFGLYDSQLQRQWEYDILQAWLVGIDAFVVEWLPKDEDYSTGFETIGLRGLLNTAHDLNQRYADKGFEFHIIMAYHDNKKDALKERFTFIADSILTHPAYYGAIEGELLPLYIYHTLQGHSAQEIGQAADDILPEKTVLAWNEGYDWDVFKEMDLLYPWVQPMNKEWDDLQGLKWGDDYLDFEYQNMNKTSYSSGVFFTIGAVWPGYDDRNWSLGYDGWFDRQDTLVYHQTWEKVLNYNGSLEMPWVLIESWNDFNRGTHIDLSVANDYTFLSMTMNRIAQFKGTLDQTQDAHLGMVAIQHLHMARMVAEQRPDEAWMIETAIEQAYISLMNREYFKTISILDLVMGIAPTPLELTLESDGLQITWQEAPYAEAYEVCIATDENAFEVDARSEMDIITVWDTGTVLTGLDLTQTLWVAVVPRLEMAIPGNRAWYQNAYTDADIYKIENGLVSKLGAPDHAKAVTHEVAAVPNETVLHPNYPNPFNPETQISYTLAKESRVHLVVYDIRGREIATLVDEFQPSGEYRVLWNAANYPSGVYFYRLKAADFSMIRRMLFLK